MPRKKKTEEVAVWPKVVVGSHLTVTTYENGRTELAWDDEALLRDVRQAILSAESRIPVAAEIKPKRTRKTKEKVNGE